MRLSDIKYFLLAAMVSCAAVGVTEATAASKKARTTQTAKKTKKKKKTSTSKSKKTAASKKTKSRKTTKKRKGTTIKHKEYVAPAEPVMNDSLTLLVNNEVLEWIPENLNPGGLRVNSVKPEKNSKTANIGLNENFTYLPVTSDLIKNMSAHIESILPDSIRDYRVLLNVGQRRYSYYITTVDKLPEKYRVNTPFVVAAEPYVKAKKGMENDIVAIWPSHGRYFKPGSGSWMWQRPQLFTVSEDTNTLSYILPYVVPMLENAGAYVMLPRERDTNPNEVIVDNDTNDLGQIYSQPYYKEVNGTHPWQTGEDEGFIFDLPDFRDTENPFENGTYRQVETITGGKQSLAAWYADIPEDGEYAVYVSYETLPNSTADARYNVNYSGGSREFIVNQTMGGGTWIYLGTFPLEAGYSDTEPIVTLTNKSLTAGKVVTADAVKIGGGMGNIARSDRRSDIFFDPSTPEIIETPELPEIDNDEESDQEVENEADIAENAIEEQAQNVPSAAATVNKGKAPVFKTSGMPRYLEGARYFMQWAGVPEDVYSPYHGADDYKDDYTNRGHWVNYLAGGSRVLPSQEGLGIPVDVCMALHSDAGKRSDDSFVGTLGIYYTNGGDRYVDGTPRANSRTLTDMLMRQITGDIRQTLEPNWTRRSMWDKSYVEARVPEVPTSLIELLSHQNFADMMYCLDPTFRFTVSRAIYKALGRFIAERKDRKFIVQPLPVGNFAITRTKKDHFRLTWQPTPDRLEPTAVAKKYLIFERTADELGFHLLGETESTQFDVRVEDNDIHSFRVVAANEGGISFPSETLAVREGLFGKDPILIINGFTRVSGPGYVNNSAEAGFLTESDFGVPYIKDISFIGHQSEFRKSAGEAHGRSSNQYATQIIAGNSFDYPYLHGLSIAETGNGFVSASVGAVVDGSVDLKDYKTIDLILGKQKTTVIGNGNSGFKFTAFPSKLQKELIEFTSAGGDLMVSGENMLSDLGDYRSPDGSLEFARNVLGVEKAEGSKPYSGQVTVKGENLVPIKRFGAKYSNSLNKDFYRVENPDILKAVPGRTAETFMTFTDNDSGAGIMTVNGKSRTAVMSIPFESIIDKETRDVLMKEILEFLSK